MNFVRGFYVDLKFLTFQASLRYTKGKSPLYSSLRRAWAVNASGLFAFIILRRSYNTRYKQICDEHPGRGCIAHIFLRQKLSKFSYAYQWQIAIVIAWPSAALTGLHFGTICWRVAYDSWWMCRFSKGAVSQKIDVSEVIKESNGPLIYCHERFLKCEAEGLRERFGRTASALDLPNTLVIEIM